MLSKNLIFSQVKAVMAERAGLDGMPSKKNLSNANAALGDFLERLELSWAMPIGDTLRGRFGDLIETYRKELQASGASPGHVRNRAWLLRFWAHLVSTLDHESAVAAKEPTPFTVALCALFAASGRKPTPTAKAVKISPSTLKIWLSGGIPARDQLAAVSRLEEVCHKAPGYLTALLPTRTPSRASMKRDRAQSTNAYRKRQKGLREDRYALPLPVMEAHETLNPQWIELLRDKTQSSQRSKASGVTWTPDMLDQLYDTPEKALADPWRTRPLKIGEAPRWGECLDGHYIPTGGKRLKQVRMLLGWASRPVAEGGAGLALDKLTLALCADYKLVRRFTTFRISRNGFPTATDTEFLTTMARLLSEHAYLPRTPAIGASIGINDPVAWEKHCAEARDKILRMRKSLGRVAVKLSRDPTEPIKDVLELESPIDALVRGVKRLEGDKASYPGSLEKYWIRDLLLMTLVTSNPLRAENLSRLTYREDNTGHVRRTPTGWRIFIPNSEMKGIHGAAEDRDYDQPIDPNTCVYLEQYLAYRSQFRESDYLFAPSSKRSKNLYWKSKSLSERFADLLRRYVPECPDGSGIHSARHIVATHIVVTTGDYILAAHLLHDEEETVRRNYAHLLRQFHERRRAAVMTPLLAGLAAYVDGD